MKKEQSEKHKEARGFSLCLSLIHHSSLFSPQLISRLRFTPLKINWEKRKWRCSVKNEVKWREKRASGMRASSFLHTSFPTQRKETSEQSKTRAHLFPLVFALYTCPLLFFNWIKDQRKKGKGTHAFFFCLYSINEKQRGMNSEERETGKECAPFSSSLLIPLLFFALSFVKWKACLTLFVTFSLNKGTKGTTIISMPGLSFFVSVKFTLTL